MAIKRQFVTRGVCIRDGKVLVLSKRGEQHFFLPGGRVEPGEGYEEALVREIEEELAQEATIKRFIGTIEHAFVHYSGEDYYEIGNFFEIDVPGLGSEAPSNEDELVFQWHDIAELSSINLKPAPVRDLIASVVSGDREAFWASTLKKNVSNE